VNVTGDTMVSVVVGHSENVLNEARYNAATESGLSSDKANADAAS